jgi:hypothetical protein
MFGKLARTTGSVAAKGFQSGGKVAWEVCKWSGKKIWNNKKEIAEGGKHIVIAGTGAVVSAGKFTYDAASIGLYREPKIDHLKRAIRDQSQTYTKIVQNHPTLTDSGIIAGALVADLLTGSDNVPSGVREAYELAYPRMAETLSFSEAISQYKSPEELQGFTSAIKGKLFEIQYVEDLNSGQLPTGYEAFLADSPVQKGWDIGIRGPNEELVEVFQLKATDSVNLVKKAIETYPDIDVVTTSELESQLLMHAAEMGDAEAIASAISDEDLTVIVENVVSSTGDNLDFPDMGFPAISLVLIAFSTYSEQDAGIYQRSYSFGQRATKSMIAYGVGGILAGITNIWWIGVLGAVGTRYIADAGKKKRFTFRKLDAIAKENEKVIQKYHRLNGLHC